MGTATFEYVTTESTLYPYELVEQVEEAVWSPALTERLTRSVRQIENGEGIRYDTGSDFLDALDEE